MARTRKSKGEMVVAGAAESAPAKKKRKPRKSAAVAKMASGGKAPKKVAIRQLAKHGATDTLGERVGALERKVRETVHVVNQHHAAIKRIENACVTKGVMPASSRSKFTRLNKKK